MRKQRSAWNKGRLLGQKPGAVQEAMPDQERLSLLLSQQSLLDRNVSASDRRNPAQNPGGPDRGGQRGRDG